MPLSDRQIKQLISDGCIRNACTHLTEPGVLSYGVSSYGYDPRLGTKFKIMIPGELPLDPKLPIPDGLFEEIETDKPFVVPPYTFFMGYTEEWFNIPRNTIVHVTGKSTYARLGLSTYVTPLEPGWTGHVTLEFCTAGRPVVIYPGEGICQFVFLDTTNECDVSYADRKGKYMDQTNDVTHHRLTPPCDFTLEALSQEMRTAIIESRKKMSDVLEHASTTTSDTTPAFDEDELRQLVDEALTRISASK